MGKRRAYRSTETGMMRTCQPGRQIARSPQDWQEHSLVVKEPRLSARSGNAWFFHFCAVRDARTQEGDDRVPARS